MASFVVYSITHLIVAVWVMVDSNPATAFECFSGRLHSLAREMRAYWTWLGHTLWRALLLAGSTVVGITASVSQFFSNPLEIQPMAVGALSGCMATTSVALLWFPRVAEELRWGWFVRGKARELSALLPLFQDDASVQRHFESADWDADDGWTAWHPTNSEWEERAFWNGLVPLVFRRDEGNPALIVPVDFEHFLVWNAARVCVSSGELLPIFPRCVVESAIEVPGGQGWWLVNAKMQDEELAA